MIASSFLMSLVEVTIAFVILFGVALAAATVLVYGPSALRAKRRARR